MLEIGSTLGGMYKVLHDVAKGGTSHVYLVLNVRAGKQWAAKEIAKDGGGEKDVIGRNLIADAEILKKLRHPNIPSIVDVIETEKYYYILMDFIEGITLQEVLNAEGAQKQEDVVRWGLQICDVFRYLHAQNPKIIYRDTKPPNIMLKPDGNVVLIDFGSAREYKPFQAEDTNYLGTRGYAAPEQFEGVEGQSDERTDIYNLGATMYHLVTGHNPSRYPYDMYPIRHWDKSLSSGLEKIILKCTRPNPEERYQTADELYRALERYRELDEGFQKKKRFRRNAMIASLFLAACCFLGSAATNKQADELQTFDYESALRNAQTGTTRERQIELFESAIAMRPSKADAYLGLLDKTFLDDDVFSREEAEKMTEILGRVSSGNRTNERWLQQDTDGYDEFAYQLGLAYFYYYEGNGNKQMSEPWFSVAAASRTLSSQKVERAKRLGEIAGYYLRLSSQNKAGDSQASYAEFWRDLSELSAGNLVEIDNAKTACIFYQELTYQIRMHASDFWRAEVPKEELQEKLEEIAQHLVTDFKSEDREQNRELLDTIEQNIQDANDAIEVAYEGRN